MDDIVAIRQAKDWVCAVSAEDVESGITTSTFLDEEWELYVMPTTSTWLAADCEVLVHGQSFFCQEKGTEDKEVYHWKES